MVRKHLTAPQEGSFGDADDRLLSRPLVGSCVLSWLVALRRDWTGVHRRFSKGVIEFGEEVRLRAACERRRGESFGDGGAEEHGANYGGDGGWERQSCDMVPGEESLDIARAGIR